MCAEAKHSAERSPWHCCKNKRIANGAYPPRPRRLRFIYDTSEPNPTFASLPASTFLETLHLVSFLKIKKNLNLKKSELNSSLKFLSLAHIFFLYFTFPSPPLSSPSSFFSKERKRVKKLRRSSCKEENSNFVGNNIVTRYFRKASEKTVSSSIVFYGSLTLMRNRPPTASEQILLSVVKSDLKMQQ